MSVKVPNDIVFILQKGKISVEGKFVWGSNFTFLSHIEHSGKDIQAVYKPIRGERPLWDFPPTSLAHREVAAYIVSKALNWNLVPPTVYREDGPMGPGSIQLFIEHNPDLHYFTFCETDKQRLRPAVLFDHIINNADRKGSHFLIDDVDHIWLIDHGVSFHHEHKLRTVVWDYAGESIPDDLLTDLKHFQHKLVPKTSENDDTLPQLHSHLNSAEISAIVARTEHLISSGHFSSPRPDQRQFPWPLL